jgi:hypothetical protein
MNYGSLLLFNLILYPKSSTHDRHKHYRDHCWRTIGEIPKDEEEVLPLQELLTEYYKKRKALEHQIDKTLNEIQEILWIQNWYRLTMSDLTLINDAANALFDKISQLIDKARKHNFRNSVAEIFRWDKIHSIVEPLSVTDADWECRRAQLLW